MKLFLIFSVTFAAYAADFVGRGTMIDKSLSTRPQTLAIMEVVKQELVNHHSNEESLRIINELLHQSGLPTMDTKSEDFQLNVSESNGFAGSTTVGIEVRDGKFRFCFPCMFGWNGFEYGIIKWEKSSRNPNGKFFESINAIDKAQRYEKNGHVNSRDWPARRHALVVVNNSNRMGILVVFDDSAEFFALKLAGPEEITPRQYFVNSDGRRLYFQIRVTAEKKGLEYSPEPIRKTADAKEAKKASISLEESQSILNALLAN